MQIRVDWMHYLFSIRLYQKGEEHALKLFVGG